MSAKCCLQVCSLDQDWFPMGTSPETMGPNHCWGWFVLFETGLSGLVLKGFILHRPVPAPSMYHPAPLPEEELT